jgi:hypothetical protein
MPHHHHRPNSPAYRAKSIARDHPTHPEHQANSHIERWFFGGFLAFFSLVALFLSAHADNGEFYVPGLLLFGLCLAGIFNLMRRSFDEQDHHK